jgi:Ribbon-helix-helix protein, copG family
MSERTTLTLEDDVAARLREEVRRQGRPLKAVVNEALRAGLATATGSPDAASPFRLEPRDLGLRPGIDLDDIQGLLDHLDEAPPP